MPEQLHTLYLTFRNDHHAVYVNTATTTIANTACNYSAYQFFNDKQGIAIAMKSALNEKFTSQLYAQVEALQKECAAFKAAKVSFSAGSGVSED